MFYLSEVIVYIWLLPIVLYIVFPLIMLSVYLFGRFFHFMLFPKKLHEEEIVPGIPSGEFENVR